MDTSEIYIKMCREAKEIQEKWEPQDGDFIYFNELKYNDYHEPFLKIISSDWIEYCNDPEELTRYPHMADYYDHAFREFSGGHEWEDEFIGFKKDTTWLPRQDQLQEMLSNRQKFYDFWKFASGTDGIDGLSLSRCNLAGSMEQLWLAFVMKEKFNKVWDGENWIQN